MATENYIVVSTKASVNPAAKPRHALETPLAFHEKPRGKSFYILHGCSSPCFAREGRYAVYLGKVGW